MRDPLPIVLGTAQLTTRYGVTDERTEDPTKADALDLLAAAARLGITTIDTAPVYGEAEAAIGACPQPFVVHTKVRTGTTAPESLAASERRLGSHPVEILYLHDPDEVLRPDSTVIRSAREAVGDRPIRIGASVYDESQFDAALAHPDITAVQVPLNLLDRRFSGSALDRAARCSTLVVVRSVLLQGVLVADPDTLPARVAHLAPFVRSLVSLAEAVGRTTLELALGWLRTCDGLHGAVLGATDEGELEAIVAASTAELDETTLDALAAMLLPEPGACDPRTWTTA